MGVLEIYHGAGGDNRPFLDEIFRCQYYLYTLAKLYPEQNTRAGIYYREHSVWLFRLCGSPISVCDDLQAFPNQLRYSQHTCISDHFLLAQYALLVFWSR